MTALHEDRVAGREPGRPVAPRPDATAGGGTAAPTDQPTDAPALRRLVAVDAEEFARDVWGRRPLLTRAEDLPAPFTDLLSTDAIDELVSRRGLRTPFLRVAKNGSTLPERAFTAPGGTGAAIADQVSDDKLVRLFADGSTMVLQGLHRVWPPLVDLAQALSADLGHPVQVNSYTTPPQSRGFDDHYDVHDVFVLQVEGEKRWRIHSPVLPAPLRDQPWTDRRAAVAEAAATEPLLDVVLRPGDCLYLPRGYLHAATALGGVSTHLTIGVHPWTRYTLAEQLVQTALRSLAEDADVRASLPLRTDVADPGAFAADLELVRERVARALSEASAEAVARPLENRSRASQRAAPVGPLAQLRLASALDPETPLALRPALAAALERRADGSAQLRSRAGDVDLAVTDVQPVQDVLSTGTAAVADLGEDLARRLVLAGVLVAPR